MSMKPEDFNLIPDGVTRVQVKDEIGKTVWRKPTDLKNSDTLQFNPSTGDLFVMFGSPGKPTVSNPNNLPVVSTPQATIQRIQNKKQDSLSRDPVLSTTTLDPESSDVLTSVLVGLAEESASLAFERQEAERRGDSTSQISLRRVNALKAVGDTWLKKKELISSSSIDLESRAFKIIFIHIAETFRKACDEAGVRPEMSESVFAVFGTLVDDIDWMREARAKLEKGK